MDTNNVAGTNGVGAEPNATANGNSTVNNEPKTYTEDDLKSEVDRRINQYLNSDKFADRIKSEREDAAKKAKMSAEERARVEAEEKEKQFNADRASFARERAVFEASKMLSDAKLPTSLSKFVASENADDTKAVIAEIQSIFNTAVEDSVRKKLKGTTPTTGTSGGVSDMAAQIKAAMNKHF